MPDYPGLAAERRKIYVDEARLEVRNSSVGFVVAVAAFAYIAMLGRGAVAPSLLDAWIALAAVVMTGWLSALVVFVRTRPDDDRVWQAWVPRARLLMAACDLVVAASVWIVLPALDGAPVYLAILTYILFVMFQAVASTTTTEIMSFALVTIFGSLCIYAVTRAPEYGVEIASLLVVFGTTIYAVRRFLRRAIHDALSARLRAERSEAALGIALAEVAGQRDAKARFIAAAAHDLQQPVAAAALYFDAVQGLPNAARAQAKIGGHSAFASVQTLLASMVDHLRLEAGGMVARPQPSSLRAIVDRVVLAHNPAAERAGVALRGIAATASIATDADLVVRALGNLVGNALKHAGSTRIVITARVRGGTAEIFVLDDGRGVADLTDAVLFDDYAQGPQRGEGGFGLGLASAQRIAILLGGTLDVDRRWTHGAAFVLRLPRDFRNASESGNAAFMRQEQG